MAIELVEEENYFFRFSKLSRCSSGTVCRPPGFRLSSEPTDGNPEFRQRGGLQDFSISRLASKMPWGIPVPGRR